MVKTVPASKPNTSESPKTEPRSKLTFGQTIRIPKTGEVVAADIRKKIIRGEIKEGDSLPSEAQLLEYYGTSRPTMREAMRILESEQFISITRGSRSGARVHSPKADSVARLAGFALQAQGALLSDVYQARLAVEPFAARMAAAVAKPADIGRLRAQLENLSSLLTDPARQPEFRVAVARLHYSIIELAGNPAMTLIAAMLEQVVESHQSNFVVRSPSVRAMSGEEHLKYNRSALKSFKKVIDLIEAGDADGAETQLRRHIENANASWLFGYDRTAIIDVLN